MTDVMSNSSSLKFLLQNFTVIKITLNEHILDVASKESYPRVNEGKQQSKQFIIYDLDSIARVNDNPKS